MNPPSIVEIEISSQLGVQVGSVLAGMQIDVLVLHANLHGFSCKCLCARAHCDGHEVVVALCNVERRDNILVTAVSGRSG